MGSLDGTRGGWAQLRWRREARWRDRRCFAKGKMVRATRRATRLVIVVRIAAIQSCSLSSCGDVNL